MPWYQTLLNYLTQKSTWLGLLSILAAFGVALKPEMADAIIACALGVFGLVNVIVNERRAGKKETEKKE